MTRLVVEKNQYFVPWAELATLWRRKGRKIGPGSEEMLAVATLREIVCIAASLGLPARNRLRIVLPNRNCWSYGYYGKQQLARLIKLSTL